MKQILSNYLNTTIELNHGGTASVRGQLIDIVDNVAKLKTQDDTVVYIAIDKIFAFWEIKEKEKALGFVIKPSHKE